MNKLKSHVFKISSMLVFLLMSFSQTISAQQANSIADLRKFSVDNRTVYKLSGEKTFVYRSGRELYIQDATGAIMIYDNSGTNALIKTTLTEGDIIEDDLEGKLLRYNNMVVLVPTKDIKQPTRNTGKVAPLELTITDLNKNYQSYEARLVKISQSQFYGNFTFNANGGQVYVWQNTTSNLILFSNEFRGVNFVGIGQQAVDVTGLVKPWGSRAQLNPRTNSDIYTGIRIACVGNSITAGYGIGENNAYSSTVSKMLGAGYDVRNYGVSGRTVLRKGDAPYWRESALQQSKEFNPDIVIIKLGTNDSKPHNWRYQSDFYQDYIDLINEYSNLPSNPKIYIGIPAYVASDNFSINSNVLTTEITPQIKQAAKEMNLEMIDFYELLKGRKDLIYDGIHPNVNGAKFMGEYVYNILAGKPVLTCISNLEFAAAEINEKNTQKIKITAHNLTSDLTVDVSGQGFAVSTKVLKRKDVEAENGYDLEVSFTPNTVGTNNGSITISGGGINPYTVSLKGIAVKQKAFNIADLRKFSVDNRTVYKLSGEKTFVYRSGRELYIQDATGAIMIYDNSGTNALIKTTLTEGDIIEDDLEGKLLRYNNMVVLVPTKDIKQPTRNTGKVAPLELTITDLNKNYQAYEARLVKISQSQFYGNFTFNANGGQVYVWQNTTSNLILFSNEFRGVNFVGIGQQAVDVTGLVKPWGSRAQLNPRTNSDIYTGIRIACVGNSITAGYGIGENNAYSSTVSKMLGAGYDVRNYGVSGRTVLRKGDAPYWRESALQQSKEFNPDIVIIKLGTNDSKPHNWRYQSDFYQDYIDLINEYSNLPSNPKIYIGIPAYVASDNFSINSNVLTTEITPQIKQAAKEMNLEMIDFYELLKGRKDLIYDGIHPNVNGAKFMGEYVYNILTGNMPASTEYSSLRMPSLAKSALIVTEDAPINDLKIINSNNGIHVIASKYEVITIYTLSGTLVKNVSIDAGKTFINLDKGLYIINNQKYSVH